MKHAIVIAAIALAACSASEPPPADQVDEASAPAAMVPPVEQGPTPAAIDAAQKALREEPKVKDLIYSPDQAVQWQIGVLDDGTSRIGYANYVCELLKESDALTGRTHVRIVDIAKVAQGTDFRAASLGHVICETGDVVTP